MAERTTEYEPLRGELALKALGFADGSSPVVALKGKNLREGALAALWRAELLAAQAGIVPFFNLPDGQQGVMSLGAARAKLAGADPAVRTIYLACHGAARRASAFARPAKQNTPRLDTADVLLSRGAVKPLGLGPPTKVIAAHQKKQLVTRHGNIGVIQIPILVVVTVIGVAALVAGAWYAVQAKEKDVQLEADKARAVASTSSLAELARAQLAASGKIDPDIIEALKALGEQEARASWLGPAALGGAFVLVAGGATAAALYRRKHAA